MVRGAGARVISRSIDMEGRPGGGGSGGWSRPPAAPPATEATRAAGRGKAHHQQQQVKVKHIVTREVSTDQASFKDVVQRLTGKDPAAARAAVVAGGESWIGSGAAVVASGGSTSTSVCEFRWCDDDPLAGGGHETVVAVARPVNDRTHAY